MSMTEMQRETDEKEYLSFKENVFNAKCLLPVQPVLQTNGKLCVQSWTNYTALDRY